MLQVPLLPPADFTNGTPGSGAAPLRAAPLIRTFENLIEQKQGAERFDERRFNQDVDDDESTVDLKLDLSFEGGGSDDAGKPLESEDPTDTPDASGAWGAAASGVEEEPEPEEWTLYGSIWGPRCEWCHARAFLETREVLFERFVNDWAVALRLGLAKSITQSSDAAEDADGDG